MIPEDRSRRQSVCRRSEGRRGDHDEGFDLLRSEFPVLLAIFCLNQREPTLQQTKLSTVITIIT
ncbi:MAG: hypothetical protein WCK70_10580 [Chloroflexales bacterium]